MCIAACVNVRNWNICIYSMYMRYAFILYVSTYIYNIIILVYLMWYVCVYIYYPVKPYIKEFCSVISDITNYSTDITNYSTDITNYNTDIYFY